MRLKIGAPRVIVRGGKCEDTPWGFYQFPKLFAGEDGVYACVHVEDDSPDCYGMPEKWFVSRDGGGHWTETDESARFRCGTKLKNGEYLRAEPRAVIDVTDKNPPPFRAGNYFLPSDENPLYAKGGENTSFPEGLGRFVDVFGQIYRIYEIDALPRGLLQKSWQFTRYNPVTGVSALESAKVTRPHMSVFTYSGANGAVRLNVPNPWGNIRVAPDGALWLPTYELFGASPVNGAHYLYSAAYFYKSEDNGRSWKYVSHIPYIPAPDENPAAYYCDGFTEPDIEIMPDGSIVALLRTAGVFHGAPEWGKSYITRSADGGKTWAKPQVFDKRGVIPQIARLNCGVTLAVYGRPGIYVRAARGNAEVWEEPVEIMTENDRSFLMNDRPARPTFHQWAGSCCNMSVLPIGENRLLIAYSDFYVPDEKGVKRKTCLTRVVEVEDD